MNIEHALYAKTSIEHAQWNIKELYKVLRYNHDNAQLQKLDEADELLKGIRKMLVEIIKEHIE